MIAKTGISVIVNLIQLIIGILISFAIHSLMKGKISASSASQKKDSVSILAASLFGALLPLDLYGVVPVVLMLIRMGASEYRVIPMLFSNMLFNMLIPFNDPTFVWRTGYARLVLAIFLGFILGWILKAVCSGAELLKPYWKQIPEPDGIKTLPGNLHINITTIGAYLVIGVIMNVIFNQYVIYYITDVIFSYSQTTAVTRFLGSYNVVHPLFLLGLGIIQSLADLTNLSGLLAVMKLKGVAVVYLFGVFCALFLGFSIFFR